MCNGWPFARSIESSSPGARSNLAAGRTTENTSSGELGARVVEVLEAAYRSAASRSIATVDTNLGRDFVPA